MIADRETDSALRAWFQEGTGRLPDRVLDRVLDGLPRVHQRRHVWWSIEISPAAARLVRVALVAALLIAIVAGVLLVAGGPWFRAPRPFPPEGERFEPGSYVVDEPFPVRLSISAPAAWLAGELTGSLVNLGRDEPDPSTEVVFTFVDALYLDPCDPEIGIGDDVQQSVGAIAADLAALPRLGSPSVAATTVDARPAAVVEVDPTTPGVGCAGSDGSFPIIGLPESYSLAEGARHRFWVVDVWPRPIVIVGRDRGRGSIGAAEVDAVIASIDFDADAPPVSSIRAEPDATTEALPVLPASGPIEPGAYALRVALYLPDASETLVPLEGQYDAVWAVPEGWLASSKGVVSDAGSVPAATFGVWSLATVYPDPCHWRTGGFSELSVLRDHILEGLSDALAEWQPPGDPDLAGPAPTPAPFVPRLVVGPIRFPWLGASRRQEIEVPPDLDLATCDDGEYRLWRDPEGSVRTAQPGERIELWFGEVDHAVVVAAAASLPTATEQDVRDVADMIRSTWVGASLAP